MGKRDTCLRLAGMLLLLVLGTGCGGPVEAAEVKVEPLDMDEDVLLTEAEVQPARWSELRFEVGGTR